MHPFPGIACIEDFSIVGVFKFVKFAEPEERFQSFNSGARLLPEINFYPACKIATETVNIRFVYPEFHSINHRLAHFGFAVVQFDDVIHSGSLMERTVCIVQIVFRMRLGPYMIPSRMVGYPVNNYLESLTVRLVDQFFEIIQCPEFRIDGSIVVCGIRTSHASLFIHLGNRGYGHEPKGFHPHFFQSGKFLRKCIEVTFLCILSYVYFIYVCGVFPLLWLLHCVCFFSCGAGNNPQTCCYQ